MLTCKNLFEVSVYRLEKSDYYNKMSVHIEKVNSKNQYSLNECYLRKNYGGDWRYNEIIGFLRFYRYGSNQIRCEYWETDAKKKVRTRKKQFEKLSDNYCNEPFHKSAKNSDLVQTMKNAVEHCETRINNKKLIMDRDLFDNIVNFIDWKSLLK